MKLYVTLLSFALSFSVVNATVRIVTCQNSPSHFLPVTVNAVVGDTIHWVWVEGNHIVGPVSLSDIPNGAASWIGPINIMDGFFDYVVTVPGNYHYVCHPLSPHGEDAYIVVTGTSGIQQIKDQSNTFSISPNPFSSAATLKSNRSLENTTIRIYNSYGQLVNEMRDVSGQSISLFRGNLPGGFYFICMMEDRAVIGTKKILIID